MLPPRIAVTMGDPGGVGPELCLRLLADRQICGLCQPVIFGSAAVLERVAADCHLPLPRIRLSLQDWKSQGSDFYQPAILDLPTPQEAAIQPGVVNAATGQAAYHYLETAAQAALAGTVDAIATAPIHKEALQAAGHRFPGHTEILADLTHSAKTCMMLTAPELTCSFVTVHVGYREVPELLHTGRIVEVIELTGAVLQRLRGRLPRLAVCGLNPHAGEHGLFGRGEEERIIAPAVEAARASGWHVEGPLPPDTAFLQRRRQSTDAFICMYHDQGHIPLKALAFDTAVNVTLGLPIIRTSVDHGTALDIAWRGLADPSSLFQAVRLAVRLAESAQPKKR